MKNPEPKFSIIKRWIPALAGMTFALIFSSWLMFHTFSYNEKTHEMRIAFKLWSDFGAHIPLIRSFSMGANWDRLIHLKPIEYPIYPGEPIRYHFIFDMIVGLMERAGLRIDWALNIPSILGFFSLMVGIYLLAKTLFKSSWVAILSIVFFLFNGSLGFLQFFDTHPLSLNTFTDIFNARDFPAFAPWGPGEITAFWNLNIYTNQRHLAGAFALVLLFILNCLYIEKYSFKKQLPWAFVWILALGILPYFHQPTLLVMAIFISSYFLFFPHLRLFLVAVGVGSAMIIIPQILLTHGSSAVAWYPGYIFHNELAQEPLLPRLLHILSFWWQNLGLHLVLMPLGFLLAPKQARKVFAAIIPLFIIPYLFKFSVEATANHKFFNLFMILGQMLSAHTLVLLFRKIKNISRYLIIGLLIAFLTLSGVIDFFVVVNDTKGTLADIPASEVATWITANTPSNAIFLNSSYLYHPASISGRSIFLGWPYFAWSAGYKENRMTIMDAMYDSRDNQTFCTLLTSRHISYITVEDIKNDNNLPLIDLAYYLKTYSPVFLSDDKRYAIFSTASVCHP